MAARGWKTICLNHSGLGLPGPLLPLRGGTFPPTAELTTMLAEGLLRRQGADTAAQRVPVVLGLTRVSALTFRGTFTFTLCELVHTSTFRHESRERRAETSPYLYFEGCPTLPTILKSNASDPRTKSLNLGTRGPTH